MAEFTEVWDEWKRMCGKLSDSCGKCPLYKLECCYEIPKGQNHYDGHAIEKIVMQWAAEHPVVYPTWEEWLKEIGVMADIHDKLNNHKQVMEVCGMPLYSIPTEKVFCRISADLAEKLGIEPKGES